mgnify:CR=1 FL=1
MTSNMMFSNARNARSPQQEYFDTAVASALQGGGAADVPPEARAAYDVLVSRVASRSRGKADAVRALESVLGTRLARVRRFINTMV